ncbi:MAG: hypothetical protein Q7U41_00265 [Microbacterium sp.]|nr:hypothetical protein [Microbacterium sp.]
MRSRASLDRLDADFIAFAVGTAMPPATPERIVADLDRPRTDLDQWNTGLTGRPSSTTTCAQQSFAHLAALEHVTVLPGHGPLLVR